MLVETAVKVEKVKNKSFASCKWPENISYYVNFSFSVDVTLSKEAIKQASVYRLHLTKEGHLIEINMAFLSRLPLSHFSALRILRYWIKFFNLSDDRYAEVAYNDALKLYHECSS